MFSLRFKSLKSRLLVNPLLVISSPFLLLYFLGKFYFLGLINLNDSRKDNKYLNILIFLFGILFAPIIISVAAIIIGIFLVVFVIVSVLSVLLNIGLLFLDISFVGDLDDIFRISVIHQFSIKDNWILLPLIGSGILFINSGFIASLPIGYLVVFGFLLAQLCMITTDKSTIGLLLIISLVCYSPLGMAVSPQNILPLVLILIFSCLYGVNDLWLSIILQKFDTKPKRRFDFSLKTHNYYPVIFISVLIGGLLIANMFFTDNIMLVLGEMLPQTTLILMIILSVAFLLDKFAPVSFDLLSCDNNQVNNSNDALIIKSKGEFKQLSEGSVTPIAAGQVVGIFESCGEFLQHSDNILRRINDECFSSKDEHYEYVPSVSY